MSVSSKVQRTIYTVLIIALFLVMLPWLYRWSFVVRDWYVDYLFRVLAS